MCTKNIFFIWIIFIYVVALGCSKNDSDSNGSNDTANQTGGTDEDGTVTSNGLKCAAGFTCYDGESSDVVWVMKNDGNVNDPTCKSERAMDENGVMRCQGHCGPIVASGCQTFFWGKDKD